MSAVGDYHIVLAIEKHTLISMCKQAGEKEFTHLIVVGEHNKKVNSYVSVVICNL